MTDVIVVGAGPTGLTLACGLQAAGVDVWVLDKASGPAVTSRALGLQPRGVEVLDRLARSETCQIAACRSAPSPSMSTGVNWRVSRSGRRPVSAVRAD